MYNWVDLFRSVLFTSCATNKHRGNDCVATVHSYRGKVLLQSTEAAVCGELSKAAPGPASYSCDLAMFGWWFHVRVLGVQCIALSRLCSCSLCLWHMLLLLLLTPRERDATRQGVNGP